MVNKILSLFKEIHWCGVIIGILVYHAISRSAGIVPSDLYGVVGKVIDFSLAIVSAVIGAITESYLRQKPK